jgi:hypothetical protein
MTLHFPSFPEIGILGHVYWFYFLFPFMFNFTIKFNFIFKKKNNCTNLTSDITMPLFVLFCDHRATHSELWPWLEISIFTLYLRLLRYSFQVVFFLFSGYMRKFYIHC